MTAETEKLIEDFATKVGDKMAGISKEITDQIYSEMLDSLQSYLADNAVFNIGAMFDAQAATIRRLTAERDEARAEAERLRHTASDLLQHIDWLTKGLPELLERGGLADEEGLIGAAVDAANSARALMAMGEGK